MLANGANLRCVGANVHMTAVTAFPNNLFVLCENGDGFHILQKRTVAFFVGFFDSGNATELFCERMEAFFIRFSCHTFVHIGPFVVFTFSSVEKVFSGIAKLAESLEPKLCVFLFIFRSL